MWRRSLASPSSTIAKLFISTTRAMSTDPAFQQFLNTESLVPARSWFDATLNSLPSTQPLPARLKTLQFRLLSSNFRNTLQPRQNTCFPPDVHDLHNVILEGPIAVQVLDVEDVGCSRIEQLERIEMIERGESRKGVVITRIVEDDGVHEGTAATQLGKQSTKAEDSNTSSGPHKVLLEDAAGGRVYGIELRPVDGITMKMMIGTKLLLHKVKVARGVLLLEPGNAHVLGGKIEELHKEWVVTRKKKLESEIEQIKNAAKGSKK